MLLIIFYLGESMYMVKHDAVREIVPLVSLHKVTKMADYIAGFFNYREKLVPVIDLRQLLQGTPCVARLSTRILLVERFNEEQESTLFGVIVERVTETVQKSSTDFMAREQALNMLESKYTPLLAGFIMEQASMIECLDILKIPQYLENEMLLN